MEKVMPMMMIVMFIIMIAGIVYVVQGVQLQNQVGPEEAKFHALQSDYFIVSKAERDGALTGSALNQQLVKIQNYPSELLRLKLVGVGKILTGIFFLLFAIVMALMGVPTRLGKVLQGHKQ